MQSLRMGAPSFISSIDLSWAHHFEWGRHGVAFPPSPLSNDFQALCLSYEFAVAEEAARRFGLPKLPQVNFYAMLLNKAERLGVLYGRTLRVMDSALTELRWNTFESWVWLNRDRIFKAWFQAKAEQKEEGSEAERAALDFELPEMVQATFYSMLLNDAIELGIVSGFLTDDLKATLEELRWTTKQAAEYVRETFRWTLRGSSTLRPKPLPVDYHGLCPRFDLMVATRGAQASRPANPPWNPARQELKWDIVEVWLLFINERLRDTQVPCLVEMVYNPQSHSEVTARLRDAPPVLSDEE
ncbi:hypothetical protein Cgig2_029805 [Carnegiea gigantea]|uniref:Uncharacterized protein n=1 Tax=Carnegiea gigantea TaxID=171969 RepID=A0A9Q1KJX7_9CARY|nr:hypothetical protein Cgig2_029805 [Carnegiea gigantea]